jgi:hypothetical protein
LKHQIPSTKSQINFNDRNPKFQTFLRQPFLFGFWNLENWSLSGIWDLKFGILNQYIGKYARGGQN